MEHFVPCARGLAKSRDNPCTIRNRGHEDFSHGVPTFVGYNGGFALGDKAFNFEHRWFLQWP